MKQNRLVLVLGNFPLLLLLNLFLQIQINDDCKVSGEKFIVGYLTGSHRRPGQLEYDRPGMYVNKCVKGFNRINDVDEILSH